MDNRSHFHIKISQNLHNICSACCWTVREHWVTEFVLMWCNMKLMWMFAAFVCNCCTVMLADKSLMNISYTEYSTTGPLLVAVRNNLSKVHLFSLYFFKMWLLWCTNTKDINHFVISANLPQLVPCWTSLLAVNRTIVLTDEDGGEDPDRTLIASDI